MPAKIFGFVLAAVASGLPDDGFAQATPRADDLVVIVSASSPVDGLSLATLRRIFLSQPTEVPGGGRFIPLNLGNDDPVRQRFDDEVLNMNPDEVPKFWIEQRIRGNGKPPKTVPSSRLMVKAVEKLDGAIGYARHADVGPGVKVIPIDGRWVVAAASGS